MTRWQYLLAILRRSGHTARHVSENVHFVAIIVAGLVSIVAELLLYWGFHLGHISEVYLVVWPTIALLIAFVVSLFFSAFEVYRQEHAERVKLETRIANQSKPSPVDDERMRFARIEWHELTETEREIARLLLLHGRLLGSEVGRLLASEGFTYSAATCPNITGGFESKSLLIKSDKIGYYWIPDEHKETCKVLVTKLLIDTKRV